MAVKVKGWAGIAFYTDGPLNAEAPESRVCMVGDDRWFSVRTADITPIGDNEYCGSCGQIGCNHG